MHITHKEHSDTFWRAYIDMVEYVRRYGWKAAQRSHLRDFPPGKNELSLADYYKGKAETKALLDTLGTVAGVEK